MAWIETQHAVAHTWMCDHFGHMNVRYYAHLFDDASFVLWPKAGVTRAMFEQAGVHTVVAQTVTDFRTEVVAGDVLRVFSRFERVGNKSVSIQQELRGLEDDRVHATQKAVEVFFDPKTRQSRPIPDTIRQALAHTLTGSTTE